MQQWEIWQKKRCPPRHEPKLEGLEARLLRSTNIVTYRLSYCCITLIPSSVKQNFLTSIHTNTWIQTNEGVHLYKLQERWYCHRPKSIAMSVVHNLHPWWILLDVRLVCKGLWNRSVKVLHNLFTNNQSMLPTCHHKEWSFAIFEAQEQLWKQLSVAADSIANYKLSDWYS